VKLSFLIISSVLTCSFVLEEKRLPTLGGSPHQAEASGGPEWYGLGERRHKSDGLTLGPHVMGFCLLSHILSCVILFCLEPLAAIVAQGSSGEQEYTGNADIKAPRLLRWCELFHFLPIEKVLEDWSFNSPFLMLSDCFYLFRETLSVIKTNFP